MTICNFLEIHREKILDIELSILSMQEVSRESGTGEGLI